MRRSVLSLTALVLALAPGAGLAAGAGGFTLVNATGSDIVALSIRRFGTEEWRSLPASPKAGARQAVSFADPDCAFDIRATLAGGVNATWSGVNLCEVKAVVLNRNSAGGATWTDYE